MTSSHKIVPAHAKTVVVGAGMAGLFAAWRILNETSDNDDLVVLEKSHRIGGRLNTDIIQKNENEYLREEEGGMRFLLDGMDNLMALLMELGLDDDLVPFPMAGSESNRYYLRGNSFNHEDALSSHHAIWSQLYHLNESELGQSPENIMNQVVDRLLQANPSIDASTRDIAFWKNFRLQCEWNGAPLYKISLWNLLVAMGYSDECITMLSCTLGFKGPFFSKMNAGIALQLLTEFSGDAKFYSLDKGYSSVSKALANRVGNTHIYCNTEVEKITKKDDESSYTIYYSCADEHGEYQLKSMSADCIILALPRLALEKLLLQSAGDNVVNNKKLTLLKQLKSTCNQSLIKLNLYYHKAWWGEASSAKARISFGPNYTDTPLGVIYPFYSLTEKDIAAIEYQHEHNNSHGEIEDILLTIEDEKYHKDAALTIYCDYSNINYWYGLQHVGPLFESSLQQRFNAQCPQTLFAASAEVVKQATFYLKKIFQVENVPQPFLTSMRIWEPDFQQASHAVNNYGFGYHLWGIGADDKEMIQAMTEIMPNIFCCGEAFSDYQGWVEGALRSTNLVLQKKYGLNAFADLFQEKNGVSSAEAIQASYYKRLKGLITKYIGRSA